MVLGSVTRLMDRRIDIHMYSTYIHQYIHTSVHAYRERRRNEEGREEERKRKRKITATFQFPQDFEV